MRLDTADGARSVREGRAIAAPGNPARSELFRRITARDDTERMPPTSTGRTLSAAEIDHIRRWIEQGAEYQAHWSFIAPVRPAIPAAPAALAGWARNAIDRFVLERLTREGLRPAAEADRTALIRRVTLDLTGLPPTPSETDTFLGDRSPHAYERLVDRLLASPRYGERMAIRWLDAARYADTNGYQSDGERIMWRWRDWVIDALNANMPFDRFTIEQIAGDMLPAATLDQKIASAFNRNHRGNAEGGIIPEEYAVEYVVDRVETTSTVWLGLTMGCVRCHEHKFDPIAHREFYGLSAYFNQVPEKGRAIKYGNSPPLIATPTGRQQQQLAELDRQLAAAEQACAALGPELASAQTSWERSVAAAAPVDWSFDDGLIAHFPLDGDAANRVARADKTPARDSTSAVNAINTTTPATPAGSAAAIQPARTAGFRDGEPVFAPGRLGQSARFDGRRFVEAGDVADFGFYDKFSCAAWLFPEAGQGGTIVSRMSDAERADGWYLTLAHGRVQLNLVKRWLDDSLRVDTEASLEPGRWHHVLATYDGSRYASGVQIYLDGRPQRLRVLLDELNQTFATKEPLRLGGGGGPAGRFQGRIDEVRVFERCLTDDEARLVAVTDSIAEIAAMPAGRRSADQSLKLRTYFVRQAAPAHIAKAHERRTALLHERQRLIECFPTTMVMQEMDPPRDTFVLIRGEYDKHGEKVSPGIPASLPPLPRGAPNNRLGFTRWLMDPAHPLTARVAVNRQWQMFFGQGLVKTVDDFGSQGEWPTHPELLDWLATEFLAGGWDVKRLQRLMVTSATYRQSSRVRPELQQRDPENRLLGRGPRVRLPAEMIRDQALAVAGLLVERLGGASVRPYQPAGLWKELTGTEDYVQDRGANLYRRSLYTFWKRTVAPPAMITFDAAGRETCMVRETRTNTPLQALTLMNDVTFVEASRALAQRVMHTAGTSPAERLAAVFRLATGRAPRPDELQILLRGFHAHHARYQREPAAARQLLDAGDSPRDERLDVCELAAYTAIAGLILNLDEVVTK